MYAYDLHDIYKKNREEKRNQNKNINTEKYYNKYTYVYIFL